MNGSFKDQLINIIQHLPPSLQLRELEKLSMDIRLRNNLRIEDERVKFSRKYPRLREESINYKR